MKDERIHHEEENRGGFSLPHDYFAQARNRLLAKTAEGGFRVPERYFEAARSHLPQHGERSRKRVILPAVRTAWYAAAAAALLVSGIWFFNRSGPVKSPDFAQLSNEEIINYVSASENISDIPVQELYSETPVTREEEDIANQLDEEIILNEL